MVVVISSRTVAAVVPAFNEEKLISKTLRSIPDYVDKIYVIDDCSTDSTSAIIKKQKDERIVYIKHQKNSGVGAAIVSGYKKSIKDEMDIAVVLAGDNQMDPKFIPQLCKPIIHGIADYTKGNRLTGPSNWRGMSKWRLLGNFMLNYLNKIASGYWHVSDPQNGYTAISKQALKKLNLDKIYKRYAFENDMLMHLNEEELKVLNIPIPARYGGEKSEIRYPSFIIGTSFYFVKAFTRRIYRKYIKKLHPIGLLYLFGFIFGIFFGVHFVNRFILDEFSAFSGIISITCVFGGLFSEFLIDSQQHAKIIKKFNKL